MASYLRHMREKRGLSQYELSELTGIPQAAISKIERGLRKPHRSTLEKLAQVLRVEQPVMLSMDIADTTFDELIDATPEERRAYIAVRREAGRLTAFIRNLQRIFDSSIKDSSGEPLTGAQLESAFMYGYAQAVADAAQLEKDVHIEKKEEVSTGEPTRVFTVSS
jgi:transcriptional regulator with XRE-family HTH domain